MPKRVLTVVDCPDAVSPKRAKVHDSAIPNLRPIIESVASTSRGNPLASSKRPIFEAFEGGVDLHHDVPPRTPKRARSGDGPAIPVDGPPSTLDSPWPSISPAPEEDPAEKGRRERQEKLIGDAFYRSEESIRRAREAYSKFRKNRMPSPASSDGDTVVQDSDADEFGCVPMMFYLDWDDPEVEDVFGAEYAHRQRVRKQNGLTASSLQCAPGRIDLGQVQEPLHARDPSPSGLQPDWGSDYNEENHTLFVAKLAGQYQEHRADSQQTTTPARRVRAHARNQSPGTNPKETRIHNSHLTQKSRRATRPRTGNVVNCEPQRSRRITRQSRCKKAFYELDYHGNARLAIQGSG